MRINPYSEIPRRTISERIRTARTFGFETVEDFDPAGDLSTPSSPWHLISKAVLNRDGYSCRVCGKSKFAPVEGSGKTRKVRLDVEVHHIIPRKMNGTDSFRNLITLCSSCHTRTFKNSYRGLPRRENSLASYSDRILVAIPQDFATGKDERVCRVPEMQRYYDEENMTYRIREQAGARIDILTAEIDFQEFGTLASMFEKEYGDVAYFTMECVCPDRQKIRLVTDHEGNIIA